MDKNLKRNILLVTIILSLAIVFVPVYLFVFADTGDDNKLEVINTKITRIIDGSEGFDAVDEENGNHIAGKDKSNSNNWVRTFDSIVYTVSYTVAAKQNQTVSGNVEGRTMIVEVLIPTTIEGTIKYGEGNTTYMNDTQTPINIDGTDYYYATFNVQVAAYDTQSTFDFSLNDINTTNISNGVASATVKPLIFIKESTDNEKQSILDASTLPGDITCAREINVVDPDTGTTTTETSSECNVNITGVEDYFINLYLGNRKTETREVPVGILVGLANNGEKGIKGKFIPSTINFTVTSSDAANLLFKTNSFDTYKAYQSDSDYRIDLFEEMTQLENGGITGEINEGVATISLTGIKNYKRAQYSNEFDYFVNDYFVTTIAERTDYSDLNANLTANYLGDRSSSILVQDSYAYVLGNYSSNIDVYESGIGDNLNQGDALEYGKANINYGGYFTLKTNFSYSSLDNSTGDGLTNLTNYVKIDNDVFKLINNTSTNQGWSFVSGESTSVPIIKVDTEEVDGQTQNKVKFGFGEWNSNYFELTGAEGCPTNISTLTKENLMNLYGGPCLTEKSTVKWAYSPVAENDESGQPLNFNKGPLIVKSTYVSNATDSQYIKPGSTGTIELYGKVVDNSDIANSSHQIVTSATAYAKNTSDFRYLGDQNTNGETALKNPLNFVKTSYDFANRNVITLNNSLCGSNRCPVSGATILVSGIKVSKPKIETYKANDLSRTENHFYYYPLAIKVTAGAIRNDDNLRFDTIYVDVYLPDYMIVDDNFGASNEKVPSSIEVTTLSAVRSRFGKEAPEVDKNYKIYHYILTAETEGLTDEEIMELQQGNLNDFIIYSDIDLITTPNASQPEIYAAVDFNATKYAGSTPITFTSITPLVDRSNSLTNIVLYNASAVTTKASTTPNNIEKNGTYTYNMVAYNHSDGIVAGGYTYPTTDLYYILPYENDMSSSEMSSKIGTTKYKVNFTSESIAAIDANDYKFYYATSGNPTNIIPSEIKTTSASSAIWTLWENPTSPVSDVIAIKVVKQSPFAPNTYFGSESGLKVNVETVGSSEGNIFYNTFHILATKPDNYECDETTTDPGYCDESRQTKSNYISSASKTSVYERIISGYVFEDYDYNGIYTETESKLSDIPVSLYKIDTVPENYDPIDPSTYVKETDKLVGTTVTGENGNYYFGGLSSGNYYVSYTVNDEKYIITDAGKVDENIPDSANNNSSASLVSNTNKAVSYLISFPEGETNSRLAINNINLGLAIKKEMAISLNKYITQVVVSRDGREDVYDYSNQNTTQATISVLNPKGTKVRVKYSFSVENTKYFPGYIGIIVDNMPTDMTFNPELKENQYWIMYDNLLYYNGLSGKLLLPNEKQYFELVLDLDLKAAGTYRNVVSARDITLMGDELPVYDFSGLINSSNEEANTQGGE